MKFKVLIKEYRDSDKAEVINLLKLNTPLYFSPEEEKDLKYYCCGIRPIQNGI